jgi:hypothetical protein
MLGDDIDYADLSNDKMTTTMEYEKEKDDVKVDNEHRNDIFFYAVMMICLKHQQMMMIKALTVMGMTFTILYIMITCHDVKHWSLLGVGEDLVAEDVNSGIRRREYAYHWVIGVAVIQNNLVKLERSGSWGHQIT